MIGQHINNFEIVRLLREGGMGSVYEADHSIIRRKVAVKLLRPELASDSGLVMRFFNEARAANEIRHPNIVEVIDVGRMADGVPYLVMEYLAGESLEQRLQRTAVLPVDLAVSIAEQAAGALQAAHSRGIVHRDIKPDNLFLVANPKTPGELVKVLDFGIAKLHGEMSTDSIPTRVGLIFGTPSYMSPEQCRGIPDLIDHRTDIYSLGVILYEMVCGEPPFLAEGPGDVLLMHLSVEPSPPSMRRAELPSCLEAVILKALAKRPEDRFASMADLAAALRDAASRSNSASEPVPATLPSPASPPHPNTSTQTPAPVSRAIDSLSTLDADWDQERISSSSSAPTYPAIEGQLPPATGESRRRAPGLLKAHRSSVVSAAVFAALLLVLWMASRKRRDAPSGLVYPGPVPVAAASAQERSAISLEVRERAPVDESPLGPVREAPPIREPARQPVAPAGVRQESRVSRGVTSRSDASGVMRGPSTAKAARTPEVPSGAALSSRAPTDGPVSRPPSRDGKSPPSTDEFTESIVSTGTKQLAPRPIDTTNPFVPADKP